MPQKSRAYLLKIRALFLIVCLVLLVGIFQSSQDPTANLTEETNSFIVTAVDMQTAVDAVTQVGGTITHELVIIDAVGAQLTEAQQTKLREMQGVMAVWQNDTVQTADSADVGVNYLPIDSYEVYTDPVDLEKVSSVGDGKVKLESIAETINLNHYLAFSFAPTVDNNNLPNQVEFHISFKEKKLTTAQIQVYQHSTGLWHTFDIDTAVSDDEIIDVAIDIRQAFTTIEDFNNIEIHFLATQDEGHEKAEVDYVNLELASANNAPVTYAPIDGYQGYSKELDPQKVSEVDGDKVKLESIETTFNPNQYLAFTFTPYAHPYNLPGLVDLRVVFKEKNLAAAQVQVYQQSADIWHTFPIDTAVSDDEMIDTTIDLLDAFETVEDFNNIQIRFQAAKEDDHEKAEVSYISLRMADLVSDVDLVNIVDSFVAINAEPVWATGNTGQGVGIAVLDSGLKKYRDLEHDSQGHKTGIATGYNALDGNNKTNDKNGHGTIVSSIISNVGKKSSNVFLGVAPDSTIIPVQVLNKNGQGTYLAVIDGIQWVIDNKDTHNIRVINMSLNATPQSYYWEDPLNQAVMQAWQAGIVVVVSAGNTGPNPMTIGVPANNPYVITVGALTDAYSPHDWNDDYIPAFSAAGPTVEGFVKPDVVAPGGHVLGIMSDKSKIAKDHPQFKVDKDYYQMSGTSMSAAEVSGVVALMLAENPDFTPDEVKYRLMATAIPAVTDNNQLATSIFQQGAGRVDAYAAVFNGLSGIANEGLDIEKDLDGIEHYGGPVNQDADGNYYIMDIDGYEWDGSYTGGGGWTWSGGWTWGGGWTWSGGLTWSGAYAWGDAWTWGGTYAWSDAWTWGGTWVAQE